MLTAAKIKIYKEYNGNYDWYYIQNKSVSDKIFADGEWALIATLIQDIHLVDKKLTDKSFADKLDKRLKEFCDKEETIAELKKLD